MASEIYQLRIDLQNIRPPIWRRILVPGTVRLSQLSEIILAAMGWYGYHLHMFEINGRQYGQPSSDDWFDMENEGKVRLQDLAWEGSHFIYEYDFGDGWRHLVKVEKVLPPEKGVTYPVCIKGKRECPPEDVGGPWGYASFLEAIKDPNHPEHEDMMEWIGEEFDPEYFDTDEINLRLEGML